MKKILWALLTAALVLFVSGCADPVNLSQFDPEYSLSDRDADGNELILTDPVSLEKYVIGGESTFTVEIVNDENGNPTTVTNEINLQWYLYDEDGDYLVPGGSRDSSFTPPAFPDIELDANLLVFPSDGYIRSEPKSPASSFSILPSAQPTLGISGGEDFILPGEAAGTFTGRFFLFGSNPSTSLSWTLRNSSGSIIRENTGSTFTPGVIEDEGTYTVGVSVMENGSLVSASKTFTVTSAPGFIYTGFSTLGNSTYRAIDMGTFNMPYIRFNGGAEFGNGLVSTRKARLDRFRDFSFTMKVEEDTVMDVFFLPDSNDYEATPGNLMIRIFGPSNVIQLFTDVGGNGNYQPSNLSGAVTFDVKTDMTFTVGYDNSLQQWTLNVAGTDIDGNPANDSAGFYKYHTGELFEDDGMSLFFAGMTPNAPFELLKINGKPAKLKQ
ncbi:MAG: hypothetical protein PQJ58_08835 [Spirochaetales bacterium]|nr:hypothetical protein [Spirochaetales bacterium]